MQHDEWPSDVDGAHATVRIGGDLDLASAPRLSDRLSQLYDGGVRTFVLDAARVTFIDSVGLSVILALYRRCRESEGSVIVHSPSRVMSRTLEVAGLFDVLDIQE